MLRPRPPRCVCSSFILWLLKSPSPSLLLVRLYDGNEEAIEYQKKAEIYLKAKYGDDWRDHSCFPPITSTLAEEK